MLCTSSCHKSQYRITHKSMLEVSNQLPIQTISLLSPSASRKTTSFLDTVIPNLNGPEPDTVGLS